MGLRRGWRRLGHAPAREHQRHFAVHLLREFRERRPDLLRNRCRSVKNHITIAEIGALEILVLFHRSDKLRETDRHVKREVAGMLAYVAYGRSEPRLRRLAFVDIE